ISSQGGRTMAVSETYEKGRELRRQLLGDAYVERVNQTAYADPLMKKFIDLATETVFGALWTRPGLDLKTRTLICVVSDAATARAPAPAPAGQGVAVARSGFRPRFPHRGRSRGCRRKGRRGRPRSPRTQQTARRWPAARRRRRSRARFQGGEPRGGTARRARSHHGRRTPDGRSGPR